MPDATQKFKYMDLDAFRTEGYLHEANRLFFHPLGLALSWQPGFTDKDEVREWLSDNSVHVTGEGVDAIWAFICKLGLDKPYINGIRDDRDDPEGIVFSVDEFDPAKVARIDRIYQERAHARQAALGYVTQPANDDFSRTTPALAASHTPTQEQPNP